MKNAVVVDIFGNIEQMALSGDSLEQLQAAVGGYIQMVPVGPYSMYVNEEGKMIGLPVNVIATALWEHVYGAGTDIIVGNAVFCGPVDDEGEDTTLDVAEFTEFTRERMR